MTMGELGFAFFFGFIMFFLSLLLVSNLLPDKPFLPWLVPSFLVGLLMFLATLLELTTLWMVLMIGVSGALLLMVLIKLISGKLK